MNLDISDCRTSFSFVTKGKEQADGETKHLKCTVTADVSVPAKMLDDWLDGHLSGAQPRDVLWRLADPKAPEGNRYPRYMSVKQLLLEVSKDRLYGFKLRSPTPIDWNGPDLRAFPGYREYAFMGVKVKALKFTFGPNGGLARFTFVLEALPVEAMRDIADLSLLEEVLCDAWCLQADALEQKKPANEDDSDDADDAGDDAEEASGEDLSDDEESPE